LFHISEVVPKIIVPLIALSFSGRETAAGIKNKGQKSPRFLAWKCFLPSCLPRFSSQVLTTCNSNCFIYSFMLDTV